jgi:hypothetical protein
MWRRSVLIWVTLLLLIAVALRLLSLQWSPLPYNIDGLGELRMTQAISGSGRLNFPAGTSYSEGYVTDMPVFNVLAAFFSTLTGIPPIHCLQIVAAFLGSIAICVIYALFRQHWPMTDRGAVSAALVLALTGSFVFSTGCVWKEVLGLVLIVFALYLFPLRDQLGFRLLMVFSLLLLVFTHHHSSIVGYTIFTFALAVDLASKMKSSGRLAVNELLDIGTISGAWTLAAAYYIHVNLTYLDYLSPETDLYLFIAVVALLLMFAVKLSMRDRPLSRSLPLGLLVPIIGICLMVYNYYRPIFSGTPGPASLILVPFIAYAILIAPASEGARASLSRRSPSKNLLIAMVFGPLTLIAFALLRSTDVTSQTIVYRTFDFIMPAFAILVGLGFALMLKNVNVKVGMAAGVSFVIICVSTLPIAYDSQRLFGVQNQTYDFEYDAVQFFSEHGVSYYVSDQRLGETGWRLFDIDYGRDLPYALREGLALNETTFYVLEGQWTTNGAQEFPFGVVVVNGTTIDDVLDANNVAYIGRPGENNIVLFRTR